MKKIIHMVTLSRSIPLMKGQLEYLENKGYNVGIVSSVYSNIKVHSNVAQKYITL